MRFQLTQEQLAVLLPEEASLRAHCCRVAAIAREIAAALSLPARALPVLEQAALLHHSKALRPTSSMDRLLRDLFPSTNSEDPTPVRTQTLPEDLVGVLSAFHGPPRPDQDGQIRTIAEVLVVSNLLDEQMEMMPLEPKATTGLWNALDEIGGMVQPSIMEGIRKSFRSWKPSLNIGKLPVQIGIVKQILGVLNRSAEIGTLADLAAQDPVVAASFVKAANAAIYGKRCEIRSLRQAIAYLGTDASRRLLMALAVRTMFASSRLREIWDHSVKVAEYFEAFAGQHNFLDPDEALLLGLVHDIGRLTTQVVPGLVAATFSHLTEAGCPVVYTEELLFGRDHGEVGAEILFLFGFSQHLIEAVRLHHRPAESQSVLSSALYLAEFWSESDEDLPSSIHLHTALRKTGCSLHTLASVEPKPGILSSLVRAA